MHGRVADQNYIYDLIDGSTNPFNHILGKGTNCLTQYDSQSRTIIRTLIGKCYTAHNIFAKRNLWINLPRLFDGPARFEIHEIAGQTCSAQIDCQSQRWFISINDSNESRVRVKPEEATMLAI